MAPSTNLSRCHDAALIGAGGTSAAAHLMATGHAVPRVESRDHPGGRTSGAKGIDGFVVDRGALAIERGDGLGQTSDLSGAGRVA